VIQLSRQRSAQAIHTSFRDAGRLQKARDLLDLRVGSDEPKSSVWKAAKAQLRRESDGKCAYCEGKSSHVAHGDVEHFRPKDEYWWLAYCYDNYLYSCQRCNQEFKGANFPRLGPRVAEPQIPANPTAAQLAALAPLLGVDPLDPAAVQLYDDACKAERAGIVNPYIADPEKFFSWTADEVLGEVKIQARNNSAVAKRAFKCADEFLGLNREELRRWRFEVYDTAATFAAAVKDPGISAALRTRIENKLRRMMSVNGEFAGMVRYVVRDVENLPL
jgi:5-methylcytosine-specific restriction endonuclease McrA